MHHPMQHADEGAAIERHTRASAVESDAATAAASVRRLTKRYGHVLAVDGLTFALAPGTITGLLGPQRRRRVDDDATAARARDAHSRGGARLRAPLRGA